MLTDERTGVATDGRASLFCRWFGVIFRMKVFSTGGFDAYSSELVIGMT